MERIALIERIKDKAFAQPELTSEWEKKLEEIYTRRKHKKGYDEFIKEIKEFVKEEISAMKSAGELKKSTRTVAPREKQK